VQVSGKQSCDLQWQHHRAHEQARQQHAVGYQLCRYGEEEEARLLPSLILNCSIAECYDESLQEESIPREVSVEHLVLHVSFPLLPLCDLTLRRGGNREM
jgi:hypothetical protein